MSRKTKPFTALSSEAYPIDPRDLAVLEDCANVPRIDSDEVVVLLGNDRIGTKDKLYQGRKAVELAIAAGAGYIPVRIAFATRTAGFGFAASLAKGIRKHFNGFGSHVYHVRRADLERLKIERGKRTEANAYRFSYFGRAEREARFAKMNKSFAERGFDDAWPMDVMVCRAFGVKDNLHQGHHRMMFSRKYGVERVAVRFIASSHMTPFLRPLFVGLAKMLGRY